jgi:iron complex transport system ATP-binding protein
VFFEEAFRGCALEVESLHHHYGERLALEDVSLCVQPGEVVGLLGPNGSGKSTLIKILSGVLPYTQGHVRLDGRDLRHLPRREVAKSLAVVPQEPIFSFPFTALEIVLMGRYPHLGGFVFESARDVALAREALARCDSLELADRTVQELSSGERQRVVFARALAQEPRALLLDEPASFLDIRHQVEICDLMRSLADRQKLSVLAVLHDLNLAAEYCDRIYLLRRGRIEMSGPTEEVFTYQNLTRVFETELYVDTNDLTGKMLVVPLSGRTREQLARRGEE